MPVVHTVELPFVRVEYDRSAPDVQRTAVTCAGAIGVAFTRQRNASWELGGYNRDGAFPAGVSMPGECDLLWRRWSDVSEAVEFWISEAWIERLTGTKQALRRLAPRAVFDDPVLIAVATQLRRSMIADAVDSVRFEELVLAATHRIVGRREMAPSKAAPFDNRRLDLINSLVEDQLCELITIEMLARICACSVFHFAKRFRASTGVSPYAYIVGRRMTRAMQLLRCGSSVAQASRAVGYGQVGHFRRQFKAHWGQSPGRLSD